MTKLMGQNYTKAWKEQYCIVKIWFFAIMDKQKRKGDSK